MINPWCPSDLEAKDKYVVRTKYLKTCQINNSTFDSGQEKKLDQHYAETIKRKLSQLGYEHPKNLKILDICGGSGFLKYHMHKIFAGGNNYHLIDINRNEIRHAKTLLGNTVKFHCGNFLSYTFKTKYDLIIGNSFLHHFTNVPYAIKKIFRLLNPRGVFIDLHEPSEKAAFVESIGRDSLAETIRLLKVKKHRRGAVGQDLWIFNDRDLKKILKQAGFKKIRIYKTGFLRTILETLTKHANKKYHNRVIETFLNLFYTTDSFILNNPEFPLFSSYFFLAFKNNNETCKKT